ncbi:hypothetical protein Calab_1480 [Caldithrix abyssi DSM 13497]|uniref:DUF1018 domain-containing protein n=2 Tax=Caldithrix abyssi TaxID=187145 RepID=H1XPX5_CALAY|nr:regulatory protein GemA [Caldithrix abyssi]APF20370.1 Protein of unknown function (DUF1018) [Caldithrix abyssi DSM 13497]EHO41101.1 hypothetical protein Calab_1480 [Caldithrix abyssi DSM 13497]
MASKKQIKLIRALAAHHFYDDDDYHDWLFDQFGKKSTKELTGHEAHEAIQLLSFRKAPLRVDGGRHYSGSGRAGDGRHFLTQAQANKIGALEYALGWSGNPFRLIGFIKKQTGKNKTVEMLSRSEASKVIIGLEKLLEEERIGDYNHK